MVAISNPAPAPDLSNMPRIDTSVGTRVFVGSRMVHGDTGWRRLNLPISGEPTADLPTGGALFLRRENDRVTARLSNIILVPGTGHANITRWLPDGFYAHGNDRVMSGVGLDNNAVSTQMLAVFSTVMLWLYSIDNAGTKAIRPDVGLSGSIAWQTSASWPTYLPGTPA